jgi:hypothetical protein
MPIQRTYHGQKSLLYVVVNIDGDGDGDAAIAVVAGQSETGGRAWMRVPMTIAVRPGERPGHERASPEANP